MIDAYALQCRRSMFVIAACLVGAIWLASAHAQTAGDSFDVGGVTALGGATIMYELLCVMAGGR